MRRARLLAIAALSFVPVLPSAAEDFVVIHRALPKSDCTTKVAVRVPLVDLVKNPDRYAGRCVAVTGYWARGALFGEVAALRGRYPASNEKSAHRRVGLYLSERDWARAPSEYPELSVAIGTAGSCEKLGGSDAMVMGYCHYTGGAYIAVASIRGS